MQITDLIVPENIVPVMRATGKEAAIRELARRAAEMLKADAEAIFAALMAREQLGSTGIGQGVAIPHARLPGVDRVFCMFARLDRPIEFAAIDERPVDLFFVLLIPQDERGDHLAALACVSRRLRDRDTARRLRAGKEAAELYKIIAAPEATSKT